MVKALPADGQVLKQTTYTESMPRSVQEASVREKMSIWEYIDDLKPEEHPRHMGYIYRWEKDGNTSVAGKLSTPFDEFTLKENFGGGSFRILLKNGAQICKRIERVVIEGKPKTQDDTGMVAVSAISPMPNGELGLLARILENQNQLFERLLTQNNARPAVDEAFRGALDLQRQGFSSVVSTVRELNPPAGTPPPNPMDDLMKQFMAAAISKMLNPADPIEAFTKMATAMSALNTGNHGGGQPSMGVEMVRAVGQALPQIASAIAAYSSAQMASAQRLPHIPQNGRTIDVTQQPQPLRANADDRRTDVVQMPGNPALSPANPNPAVQPPTPATPPQGGDMMAPNVEWLEAKVVDLINNLELTPEQAASDAASFLQTAAPPVLAQLSAETSLRWVFANRAIMQKVKDPARRERFIVEFLRLLNPAEPVATAAASPDGGLLLTPEPPPAS